MRLSFGTSPSLVFFVFFWNPKGHSATNPSRGAGERKHNRRGSVPLFFSVSLCAIPQVCDQLLEKGADVNASDNDGRTPLVYAVVPRSAEVCLCAYVWVCICGVYA